MNALALQNPMEIDPMYCFELWCRGNGYADVFEGAWDADRMTEAVNAYSNAGDALEYVVFDPNDGWRALALVQL